jgi:glycosyltransferase involved in cell wall biosynthesis
MSSPDLLSAADSKAVIAYLGPEVPALSATFIYEEMLGLERRGLTVRSYTVRRPQHQAPNQESLALRTQVLYDRPVPVLALRAMQSLPSFGGRAVKALSLLARDVVTVGLHRPVAWKLIFHWLVGARLARSMLREGCTHLHVHFAHTPAQIAMYASALSSIPFTITAHANDIFERGLLLPQKAMRAAKLVTISHFNLRYLQSVGVANDRLAVVRCGVSFARRSDPPAQKAKSRYRIGTLCRLVEKKGVDDLLHALSLLHDAPWPVELSVAGDGPMRGDLERMAVRLGLAVQFVGALGHADVPRWLHSLDAFVIAAKKDANGDMDGIPVALMEAMSQCIPVVSTRLSGIPELVIHEHTGLLAAPADPVSLARELRRLLDDPELRTRLAAMGVEHVEREFGHQANLDRLLGVFASSLRTGDAHIKCAVDR